MSARGRYDRGMRRTLPLLLLALAAGCRSTGAGAFDDDAALRAELLARMEVDQAVRNEALTHGPGATLPPELLERWMAVDADNTAWIERVLDARGWPPRSAVQDDGATAVFLLVQHADQRPDLQRRALPMLKAAVEAGEAKAVDLALLTDRVRLKDGRPQVYGSQIRYVDGVPTPYPIEDAENVDLLRAAMGLEPMADYLARFR